jgi:hypothetical protein
MVLAGAVGFPLTLRSGFVPYDRAELWHQVLAPPSIIAFVSGVFVGVPLLVGGLAGMLMHDKPCDMERHDQLAHAEMLTDSDERRRALAAVPVCTRRPSGAE